MRTKGDSAIAACSNFANGKIGTPKEILDTPKENPITPRVMALSPVNSALDLWSL
jgi:hypothetical protein